MSSISPAKNNTTISSQPVPDAELLRRQAGAFAELLGKSALVAEAMLKGDLDDRGRCLGQGLGSGLDAGAQQQFMRGDAQGFLKLPVQMPFG